MAPPRPPVLASGSSIQSFIDVVPAQVPYLRHSAAGQQKQAEGGYCRGHLFLGLAQDLAQPLGLFRRQEPFPLVLLVALDMPAGIGAVGAPAPDFGEGEHLGQHPERPVGLIGLVPQAVMQCGDVLALYLWNPQLPDHGVDKQPHRTAVLFPGARFAVDRDIFLQEPAPEISHAWLSLASGVCVAWIDAFLRTSQYLQRAGHALDLG